MRPLLTIAFAIAPIVTTGCGSKPIRWADPEVIDRAIANAEAQAHRAGRSNDEVVSAGEARGIPRLRR